MGHLNTFVHAEDGAITVDWTVLTGSLVGLGLATLGLVSTGVEDTSGAVADNLSGFDFRNPFANFGSIFSTDFSDGGGGWFGGTVDDVNGFGDVMMVAQNEVAEMSVDVPDGADSVTFSFDLIAGDDMDGDTATIYIDGEAVALYTDNHGNITTADLGVPGVSVQVDQQYTNDPVGGGSHGHDSRATYTIEVSDPPSTMTFGVGSNASADFSNEFYAIDDLDISTR